MADTPIYDAVAGALGQLPATHHAHRDVNGTLSGTLEPPIQPCSQPFTVVTATNVGQALPEDVDDDPDPFALDDGFVWERAAPEDGGPGWDQ